MKIVNQLIYSLKILFNIFKRNIFLSLLSIIGLAIGFATIIILFNYLNYELSYDRYVDNHKKIYRVVSVDKISGDKYAGTNCYLADRVLRKFSQFKNISRVYYPNITNNTLCRNQDEWIIQDNIFYVDSPFLKLFNVQLEQGNITDFNNNAKCILINQTTKNKYFGNKHVIGEILEYKIDDQIFLLKIVGVFKDFPSNSHIRPEVIAPFDGAYWPYENLKGGGNPFFESNYSFEVSTYFQMISNAKINKLEEKINKEIIDSYGIDNIQYEIELQSLKDIHLYSSNFKYDVQTPGNVSKIIVLAILFFIVFSIMIANLLFFDSIIFNERTKEIYIQKIYGLKNASLFLQLFLQSAILLLVTVGVSFLLIYFSDSFLLLSPNYNSNLVYTLILCTLFLLTIIRYIIIKSKIIIYSFYGKRSRGLRIENKIINLLLGVQFVLFILSFNISMFINKQVESSLSKDNLGFDFEDVISIRTFIPMNCDFVKFRELKEKLLINNDIVAVTASSLMPPATSYYPQQIELRDNYQLQAAFFQVDPCFFKVLKIKLIKGKSFNDFLQRFNQIVVVNEKFIQETGFNIGDKIYIDGEKEIVGICTDFHSHEINTEKMPVVISPNIKWYHQFIVRINPIAEKKAVLDYIKQQWNSTTDDPFIYYFNEDLLKEKFKEEHNTSYYAGIVSYVIILIMIFSLISMILYSEIKRRKSLVIHMIHGANKKQLIFSSLKKQYITLFLSAIIAVPLSIMVTLVWKDYYVLKIDYSIINFFIPILIIGFISTIVSIIVLNRLYNINPVTYLYYE